MHSQILFAQDQRSIVNIGFEENDPQGPGSPSFQFFDEEDVPGWQSTTGIIELWDSNFLGVDSFEGNVHAELNATSPGALFQNVCLVNGDVFDWTFAHRARSGGASPQVATFEIASPSGALIQVLGTQSSFVADEWNLNSDSGVVYTGPSGIQRIQFSANNPGSVGNFLDSVTIILNPFIEFNGATASGDETDTGASGAAVFVSGTISTPLDVAVTITGGSALLGSDYTTPSGTATFNVTIPVGNHTQTSIPLGISVVDDDEVEAPETIEFSIVPQPSEYTLTSTNICGTPAQTTLTYEILDNDASVNFSKQWLTAELGDQATISVFNGSTSVDTFVSVADSEDELDVDSTPTVVTFGDTLTFDETLPTTNLGNYVSEFSCTGAADTDLSDGLTIGIGEVDINCVLTNTRSNLSLTKTVQVISDGVNASNPKAIPGARVRYCILTTNIGQTTANAIEASDEIPSDVTFVSGSLMSGTSCTTAATPEDEDDAGADESDPFGISFSGTIVSGIASSLAASESFAMVFDVTVN